MGVPQDYATALMWYFIAARNGSDDAAAAVARLRASMSGGDIGRARSRADAFKPEAVGKTAG
jgi:TPR repeat protein